MSLKAKLENVFAQYIERSGRLPLGVNVYRGAENEIQRRPCVVCHAKSGEGAELVGVADNRFYNVTVMIKGEAELKDKTLDSVNVHNATVQAVFGILQVPDLAERLSEFADELTIFSPIVDLGEDPDVQGRAFVDALAFQVYCCSGEIFE